MPLFDAPSFSYQLIAEHVLRAAMPQSLHANRFSLQCAAHSIVFEMSMPAWAISYSGLISRRRLTSRTTASIDEIDLFLRREPAQAEADAAVGQFVADAQRLEHVARLQAGRRAGRAAARPRRP